MTYPSGQLNIEIWEWIPYNTEHTNSILGPDADSFQNKGMWKKIRKKFQFSKYKRRKLSKQL